MQKMKKIKEKILSISLVVCLLFSGCETTSADPEKNENTLTGDTSNSAQNTLFREGLLAVKEGDMWGYINENGEYVIEPQFKNAFNFMPNGLAIAGDATGYGLIDKTGKYILEPTYGVIEEFDENGIAKVGFFGVDNQNKVKYDVGLINDKGECILDTEYVNISTFNKFGWALADKLYYYDYVNTKGEFMMINDNHQITEASKFFDSKGWVKVHSYYTSGYYDSNGDIVIPIEYNGLGNFAANGLAYAQKGAFDW